MEHNIDLRILTDTLDAVDEYHAKVTKTNPDVDMLTILENSSASLIEYIHMHKHGRATDLEVFGKAASMVTAILYYMSDKNITFDSLIKFMNYLARFGVDICDRIEKGDTIDAACTHATDTIEVPEITIPVGGSHEKRWSTTGC